jgi:hypothetical protein
MAQESYLWPSTVEINGMRSSNSIVMTTRLIEKDTIMSWSNRKRDTVREIFSSYVSSQVNFVDLSQTAKKGVEVKFDQHTECTRTC